MHLDTVFTMLDRDKVTAYPQVVDQIRAISLRPGSNGQRFHVTEEESFLGAVADAMGVPKLQVVETGGDAYQQEREQWDDGNNVVALEPGVVVAYERNTYTIAKMREAGVEVDHHRGVRARQGPRWRALHDLPADPGPGVREAAMSLTCLAGFMVVVLLACVVGLLIWARGPEHHHGQDVGALRAPSTVAQGLEG